MKVLISAAEISSDAHGAQLLSALRALLPAHEKLEAFGIGGVKLQEAGLETIADARDLLAMGSTEVLMRLPKILRALRSVTASARDRRPDVAIVIDYPDFHFRLAKRLKEQGVPVIYYIPPKVWVWRKRRVQILRERFAKILCILPFEESFYREAGVSVKYVGNPLADELPLQISKSEARKKLGIDASTQMLALLPGSRPAELKRHFELMLNSAARAARRLRENGLLGGEEKLLARVSLTANADREHFEKSLEVWRQKSSAPELEVVLSWDDSALVLASADAGLIKSGTSTLEAALLKCPHVVVYKPSGLTSFLFKHLVRYRGPVGLVNLFSGWKEGQPLVARELLMDQLTVDSLSEEAYRLLTDESARAAMIAEFEKLRNLVTAGESASPSETAAREILEFAQALKRGGA